MMNKQKKMAQTLNITHPITCQSGTFRGSLKMWSTLAKEAYAIYMSF